MVLMISFMILERGLFAVMGEKLTNRLKKNLVEELLHKQMSWFDSEDKAPGIIANVVGADV